MPSRQLNLYFLRAARIFFVLGILLLAPTGTGLAVTGPRSNASDLPVELLSRRFIPNQGLDPALRSLAANADNSPSTLAADVQKKHIFVQFYQIPTPQQRADLARAGLTLLNYIPKNTWYASVRLAAVAALSRHSLIRWMGVVQPLDRQPAALAKAQLAADTGAQVALQVQFAADVPLAQGQSVVESLGGSVVGEVQTINTLMVYLPANRLTELSQHDEVFWIEPPLPHFEALNDGIRQRIGVDTLYSAPYSLDGSGVNILIYDIGTVNTSHPAFQGRLTVGDSTYVQLHSTHVAGTAAGNGTGSPSGRDLRGMAPAARIFSYGFQGASSAFDWLYADPGDIEHDWLTANADVSNASIGTNVASRGLDCAMEGGYGASSQLIDDIVRGKLGRTYITVWAAGNERASGICGTGYGTTPPPSNAKNPIHVGATNSDTDTVAYFSSFGPSDDGRLEPTIAAPGCEESGERNINSTGLGNSYTTMCGTSMAAPAVTGLSALIVQRYRQVYNTSGNPLPATVKAVLIHTATDLGNPGPDYQSGYGRVNGVQAIDALTNDFHEDSFSMTGETHSYTIAVPAGQTELKVSMAWDDFPAAPNALVQLVNDLDLSLISPSGTVYYPWVLNPQAPANPAATGEDHLNNQEQVLVNSPEAGIWTVRVAAGVLPSGPQSYAIVFSGARTAPRQVFGQCFTLTTASVPAEGGSISVSPAPNCNTTQYEAGTVVEIRAVPSAGYLFATWEGDVTDQINPHTITMSSAHAVTAHFQKEINSYFPLVGK